MPCIPVVTMADFISAGDQSGCNDLSNATIPVIWGAAIDVPDLNPKLFPNDAKMLTPGAAISGWKKVYILYYISYLFVEYYLYAIIYSYTYLKYGRN